MKRKGRTIGRKVTTWSISFDSPKKYYNVMVDKCFPPIEKAKPRVLKDVENQNLLFQTPIYKR